MAKSIAMESADEINAREPFPTFGAPTERADGEYECELMIEALTKELTAVKNQLAFLTHHLDREYQLQKQPDQHDQYRHSSHMHPATTRGGAPADSHLDLQATGVSSNAATRRARGKKIKPLKQNVENAIEGMTESEVKELHHHYLAVVDRAEKERWEARKRCLVLMQARIEQQLQTLQERAERFQKKLDRMKRKERAERLKLKPPRFKSTGVDDTGFLTRVPQSTFYKIVGLEHELKVEGKLRTLTDVKEFWEHMLTPTRQSTATQPSTNHRPPSTPFTLREEEEEEEYSDSWAITALPPQHSTYSPRRSPIRVHTATPITPPTPDSMRFIPMKIPQFKSVSEILGEDKPSWNVVEWESDCNFRARELETEQRKLHHMYHQARTHEMIMQRLLPEVPHFKTHPVFAKESKEQYHPTKTKPEETHSHQLQQSQEAPVSQQPLTSPTVEIPKSRVDRSTSNSQLSRDSDHEMLKEERSLITTGDKESSALGFEDHTRADGASKIVLIPLTMDTAMNNFPVRGSKCKSALWTNYLMAKGCS